MDPWTIPEFRTGLGAGVVAALLATALTLLVPPLRRAPAPLAGAAVAVAGAVAIALDGPLPTGVIVGMAGLAVVAVVAGRAALDVPATALLGAPAAWLIAVQSEVPTTTWVRLVVVLGASLGAALVARADLRWRRDALGPPLWAVTVVGVHFTVPDTEQAAALLGVSLPLALLGWPIGRLRLGAPGAAAATGLLCWAAADGGRGRPASILGALACLALLAGVPAVARRARARGVRVSSVAAVGLLATHLGLVYVGSRVAGLRHDVPEAALLSAVVLLASVAVGALLDRHPVA